MLNYVDFFRIAKKAESGGAQCLTLSYYKREETEIIHFSLQWESNPQTSPLQSDSVQQLAFIKIKYKILLKKNY